MQEGMVNIIFDTNAARDFVTGVKLEGLAAFAKNMSELYTTKGLRLIISPIVIMELLCHLRDTKDKDFSVSFKAIKAMMLTQEYQLNGTRRSMMSPGELLVANEIYHMHCEQREQMYMSIMAIAEEISHRNIDNLPDLHTIDGNFIKDYVDDIEKSFAQQFREVCKSVEFLAKYMGDSFETNLNTLKTECLLATYFTRTTYNLLMNEGKVPDYRYFLYPYAPQALSNVKQGIKFVHQMEENNKEVIRRYPAFISLAKEVIKRIHLNKNMSDDKLHNYIWDINLMFHINDHTICHEPLIFITSDKAMLLASGVFHDTENVLKYDEFKHKFKL